MPGSQLHLNKSLSSPSPVTPTLREQKTRSRTYFGDAWTLD
ncbi:hypothetical protein [Tolypothrix sp. VBCCA 56010]